MSGPVGDLIKGMQVNFTPDQEAQLAQLATKAGMEDAEHLVKNAALRLLEDETNFHAPVPELPVLHLGPMKSLHRQAVFAAERSAGMSVWQPGRWCNNNAS